MPCLRPLVWLVLLAACLAGRDAWAGERVVDGGHRVRWDDGLEALGENVARRLPGVRREVEAALGFEFPGGPAEVVVVSGLARIREETAASVPEWAAGVCQGSRSRIVLRADRVDVSPLNPMVSTLRHEWVHLAWSRRAGPRVRLLPLWVEEGLAEDIGGGVSVDAGAQLDLAARFGWLLKFDTITQSWPEEASDASLAYQQSLSFVRFFRKERGDDVFQKLLRQIVETPGYEASPSGSTPFDDLVYAETGSSLGYWIAVWNTRVEEQADPWFHLLWRDFQWTILIALAIVSMVFFVFFQRRRMRQIAALPDHPLPPSEPQDSPYEV
ncbi:MAG: hypothetical protein O2894_03015 [Planctomycetota bacterium]|nr:hypothetical protein [Planctomycetota bacterium]